VPTPLIGVPFDFCFSAFSCTPGDVSSRFSAARTEKAKTAKIVEKSHNETLEQTGQVNAALLPFQSASASAATGLPTLYLLGSR
jgi:hypothetical protein